jgi:hypothetical protein
MLLLGVNQSLTRFEDARRSRRGVGLLMGTPARRFRPRTESLVWTWEAWGIVIGRANTTACASSWAAVDRGAVSLALSVSCADRAVTGGEPRLANRDRHAAPVACGTGTARLPRLQRGGSDLPPRDRARVPVFDQPAADADVHASVTADVGGRRRRGTWPDCRPRLACHHHRGRARLVGPGQRVATPP